MTRRHDDEGVAALELALLLTLLIAITGLVAPLAYLYYERVQLGRSTGDVIRFATSRTSHDRHVVDSGGATIVIPANAIPSLTAVKAEAKAAYTGRGAASLTTVSLPILDSNCPSGTRLSVTLTTVVNVNAFTGILINGPTKTLTATATSCEE